ncbi:MULTISPECIES: glycosyltransferase [unclassified Flavobacterium]|uniref:glycosyltransferase n=1 Tax=unclassified Flavobacterium TaxID=196869 RepID=UPI001F1361C9|nr:MULTISPECIES: glycosyltransferase [unclassified Flavobacterium]UMY67019.1 glycosyltransferase family 4 protein [Flavobacterium sp. HJ-32-4]
MIQKVLVIGLVWPEPSSSAAGTRMLQLLQFFLNQGASVRFASAAQQTEFTFPLESIGVETHEIKLNDSGFDDFLRKQNPDLVLFDRYITEEQFGWRVAEAVPNALRILDTEDLHCLRAAREAAVKNEIDFEPGHLLLSPIALREIAAIYRSDLSIMISQAEIRFLVDVFGVPHDLLWYLPFLYEPLSDASIAEWPSFQTRKNYFFIGNFRHYPNHDALRYLKTVIWPRIRALDTEAILYVYGAYVSPAVQQLHHPGSGFYIMGRAESVNTVMREARVLLAPLRIGAGHKGKLAEAMQFGLPSVTTSIGAEGMTADGRWGGYITDEPDLFAKYAVDLYHNQELWQQKQQEGTDVFRSLDPDAAKEAFWKRLADLRIHLPTLRIRNFIGRMLTHHTMSSYKYLSRWIEEKEKRNP